MQQRMKKELNDLSKLGTDSLIGIKDSSTPGKYVAWVKGPDDTPYEDGVFLIDVVLPPEYPFQPPKMSFQTKVWHPNISSVTGAICLDTLKGEWTPALTIRTALLSVLALFTAANPTDPQDHVVAKQYMSDHAEFEKKAREWTMEYAAQNIDLYKGPRYKSGPNSPLSTPIVTPAASNSTGGVVGGHNLASNANFKYKTELTQLVEMGFDERQARMVLEQTRGNIDEALVKFQTL
jgi:ubiquitin-conjugating enzyme (huntingtin interacting protein 2)